MAMNECTPEDAGMRKVVVKIKRPLNVGVRRVESTSDFDFEGNTMELEIECHPSLDGVTHCNIYSRGKTRLGRLCSNHADVAIEHPIYGHFRNMEGLWYYLRTGMKHESLRVISAFDAREYGKTLEKEWNADFNREFKMGIVAKVQGSEEIRQLLTECDLPFVHYYVYGKDDNAKVIVPKGHEWQMLMWERIRDAVKHGRSFDSILESLKQHPKRVQ